VQPGMLVQAVEAHSQTTPATATARAVRVPVVRQIPGPVKTIVALKEE
jgi:hypothetical protein